MSFITSKIKKSEASGTITPGEWGRHEAGNYLLAIYRCESRTVTFADPSLTALGQQNCGSNMNATIAFFGKVASSDNEPNPSATSGAASYRSCETLVIKYVDTANPIDTLGAIFRNITSPPYDPAAAEGSYIADKVLGIHVTANDQVYSFSLDRGIQSITNEFVGDGQSEIATAWTFQKLAGASQPFKWMFLEQNIRNSFTAHLPIRLTKNVPRVSPASIPLILLHNGAYRNTSSTTGFAGYTFENVASIVPSVAGLTTSNASVSNSNGVGVNALSVHPVAIPQVDQTIGLISGDLAAGAANCTGKKICFVAVTVQGIHAPRTLVASDHGIIVALGSSNGNRRFYDSGGLDTVPHYRRPTIIDASSPGIQNHQGAVDFSAITSAGVGIFRNGDDVRLAQGRTFVLDTIVLDSGDDDIEADWEVAYNYVIGMECPSIERLGDGFETGQDIQVGPDVNFKSNGKTLTGMPQATDTDKRFQAQETRLILVGNVGSKIRINEALKNLVINIDAASSPLAVWEINTSVTDCEYSSAIALTLNSATFVNCATLIDDPTIFNSSVFKGDGTGTRFEISGASEEEIQDRLDKIANNRIEASEIGINLVPDNLGANYNLDLSAVTFDGVTSDIGYAGTGNIVITNLGGSNAATSNSNNVSFVDPVSGITFSGLLAGSQVIVFAANGAELFRTDSSSTTEVWAAGGDQGTVTYTIYRADMVFIKESVTVGTNALSFTISQKEDRAYQASTGLIYTTDTTYNAITGRFTLTKATTLQNFYCFYKEQFISNAAFANKQFPIVTNGPNSFSFINGVTFDSDLTIERLSRDGLRYIKSSGAVAAVWAAVQVLTETDLTGLIARYQQTPGGNVINANSTGAMDQLIKIFGDADNGDFDLKSDLVVKYKPNPYSEARVDVVAANDNNDLEDQLYVIAANPSLLSVDAGNPNIDITITDHADNPVTWNGKVYSVTVTDNATASGVDIVRQINFDANFNYPDIIVEAGTTLETARGIYEGSTGAPLKGARVLRGGQPHPDITRFNADDGTYYAPPQAFSVVWATLLDGTVFRIYNKTRAVQLHNSIVAGGSGVNVGLLFGDGEQVEQGDELEITALYVDGATQYWPIVKTVTVNSATNIPYTDAQVLDSEATDVALAEGWRGIDIDKDVNPITGEVRANFADIEILINDPDGLFDVRKGVIWFNYRCATQDGIQIYNPNALVRGPDIRNIIVNGPIKIKAIEPVRAFGSVWEHVNGDDIIAADTATIIWMHGRVYNGPTTQLAGEFTQQSIDETKAAALAAASSSGQAVTDIAAVKTVVDDSAAKALEIETLINNLANLTPEQVAQIIVDAGLSKADVLAAVKDRTDLIPTDIAETLGDVWADAAGDITRDGLTGVETFHGKDGNPLFTSEYDDETGDRSVTDA